MCPSQVRCTMSEAQWIPASYWAVAIGCRWRTEFMKMVNTTITERKVYPKPSAKINQVDNYYVSKYSK